MTLALRNFDFKEKAQVDKFYPQYYHKMDNVRPSAPLCTANRSLIIYIFHMLGRPAGIHRAPRAARHQGSVLRDHAGAPAPAARIRIRKVPRGAAAGVRERARAPGRDVVHDPRPGGRLADQLLPRQGLRDEGRVDRAGPIPRDDGQVLHHQCAVGVLGRVGGGAAVAGRGDGVQDQYSGQRVQGGAVEADTGGLPAQGLRRDVRVCRRVFA